MGLEAIGKGIKTRLETISGLRVFDPSDLPDSINHFPCALILPGETKYDATFADNVDYILRIIIVISKQDQPSALNKLLDYIEVTGTYSIVAAIKADRTLGGSADASRINRNLGLGEIIWGGITYLSTEFEILVWK